MGPEQAVDDAMQRICAGSVSTHALREESDAIDLLPNLTPEQFQSTPSARRATEVLPADTFKINLFQSTPSARRATYVGAETAAEIVISIHALREEGDMAAIDVSTKTAISIHALREEGDVFLLSVPARSAISIHALREEGDSSYKDSSIHTYLFQSTPSARRATLGSVAPG